MLVAGVDGLNDKSRTFYEYAKEKLVFSVMGFGFTLYLLAKVCEFGGLSSAANDMSALSDDELGDSSRALAAGYGFGAFFMFCAFAVAMVATWYINPFTNGTKVECAILKKPQDIEAIDA